MARACFIATLVALLSVCGVTHAEPEADPNTEQARGLFRNGSELAKDARWGEALAHFERSAALRPHPGTTYNIAICQRALGRYARAERAFHRALKQNTDSELAASVAQDIRGYLVEIQAALARVQISLSPPGASISVDGAPLEVVSLSPPELSAGTLPAGAGRSPPAGKFLLIIDPGTHLFVINRKGYADTVVRRTFGPGQRATLDLALDRLPATLRVTANEPRSAVSVDGIDVGLTPVQLSRPAGSYRIVVQKAGFLPYEAAIRARAGQSVEVPARLARDEPALTERWWFWTAAGVVVAGAILGTYAATRPEPDRPALSGGGLGWTIRAP